jgi:hypothetical protein
MWKVIGKDTEFKYCWQLERKRRKQSKKLGCNASAQSNEEK